MPISNSYRLREGDTVLVRTTLYEDARFGRSMIAVEDAIGDPVDVMRADADLVETLVLVGDEVRVAGSRPDAPEHVWPFGIVIAIDGARGTICWPNGDELVNLDGLTRVRTAEQVAANEARPDEHRTVEPSDVAVG